MINVGAYRIHPPNDHEVGEQPNRHSTRWGVCNTPLYQDTKIWQEMDSIRTHLPNPYLV